MKSLNCHQILYLFYYNEFVTQYITYFNFLKMFLKIQVSDMLSYELINCIWRTSLSETSSKFMMLNVLVKAFMAGIKVYGVFRAGGPWSQVTNSWHFAYICGRHLQRWLPQMQAKHQEFVTWDHSPPAWKTPYTFMMLYYNLCQH